MMLGMSLWSSGLGRLILSQEIAGSNPAGDTEDCPVRFRRGCFWKRPSSGGHPFVRKLARERVPEADPTLY